MGKGSNERLACVATLKTACSNSKEQPNVRSRMGLNSKRVSCSIRPTLSLLSTSTYIPQREGRNMMQSVILESLPRSNHGEDSWEVVSDVASVFSLGSVAETYAEIVKLSSPPLRSVATSPVQGTKIFQSGRARNRSKSTGAQQVPEPTAFDAFFVMEGVKNARGGKPSLMFKGNPRTQKPRKKEKKR